MTREVPTAFEDETLAVLHQRLVHEAKSFKTVHYVYVLDRENRLIGVLSIGQVFSPSMHSKIGELCKRSPLPTVHPTAHQETVAYQALRHSIKSVPVVDKAGHFLGAVTSDTILSILHKEMHEDTLKRAGIRHPDAVHANVLSLSLFASYRHRIPWLLLGLIGGILSAKIIGFFESTLSQNLVLASFIPLIVYMSDAVRAQMEAYILRDLSFDPRLVIFRYMWRNLVVVAFIGLSLAVFLGASYGLISDNWYMSFVLSVSLFTAVLSSVCTGLLIPFAFTKCSLDPADASGPTATIIQDLLSIVIYFTIATVLL